MSKSKFNLEDVLMQVIESSEDESENCVELLDTKSVEEVVRELTSVNKANDSVDRFSNESGSDNNDDGDPDFEVSDSNTDTDEIDVDKELECQSEDQFQIEPNLTTNDTQSKTNDHPDIVVEAPRGRKRTRNEELWQRNIRKRKRQVGDEYISQKGVRIPRKGPKNVNCTRCRQKCSVKISEDRRKDICDEYYKLGDATRQKDFICALTLEVDIARRRKRIESSRKNRDKNYQYFLPLTDTENVRVCKLFFTKTLSISHSMVTNALNNKGVTGTYIGTDKRINKAAPNRLPENSVTVIKDHINSFPRVEPHYCRKDTTCQYLNPELNISKMYRLYLDFCKDREVEPVKESMYRHIFVTQFNLKFFVPKKDQCSVSYQYYAADDDGKSQLSENWNEHKAREREALEEKNTDKEKAKIDNTLHTVSFDLQAVLSTPHAGDAQIYYKRKLAVYNFTVYENHTANGHCFVWDETEGGRGSNEIGSILLNYLSNLPQTISHFTSFSDTCGGQNRNQFIVAAMLFAVQHIPHLKIVDLKYMESGHSYLEADSMYATIEKAKRHQRIFTPREWVVLIAASRRQPRPYIVKQLYHPDFLDIKDLCTRIIRNRTKNTENDSVNWLKIKWLRFEKTQPNIVQYKYRLTDKHFHNLKVCDQRDRRSIMPTELKKAYSKQLPVSVQKKADLLSLLKSGVIPKEYLDFYQNLPSSSRAKDDATSSHEEDDDN